QNGAKGATLTQMQAALRASGLTTEQQNAGWQALLASWAEDAKADGISFNAANAYFGQVGAPVNPAFLSTLGQYYDAGVWQVDFADQLKAAADTINAWADQQTNGKIKKLFDARDLDPQTLAVLANAVYFKAAWADPFVTDNSAPADFHTPSGITRPTFMNSTGTTATGVITPDYQAAQLPYTGDRFAATIIMPTTESLSSFVSALTPADLAKITSALDPATTGASQAVLSLPRFTTTSDLTLNQALIDLGMPDAFGPAADFTAMSPLASHISLVKQMVYLSVTEQGTEAAAVTGIAVAGMGAMAPPLVITVDHPFLFLIRDTQTGAILFAAEITDPQD
ncbi:MAG: serpin family protein, partial [Actinomycetia bacterium]|nr:serpin family protein [Actinomycetes bacterium]